MSGNESLSESANKFKTKRKRITPLDLNLGRESTALLVIDEDSKESPKNATQSNRLTPHQLR